MIDQKVGKITKKEIMDDSPDIMQNHGGTQLWQI